MNKKRMIIVLLAVFFVASIGFFSYFIYNNERQKAIASQSTGFRPEEIDISEIDNDLEFAQSIPEYRIMITGLVSSKKELTLEDIVTDYQDMVETKTFRGIRSDEEEVVADFSGIRLENILEDVTIEASSKEFIVYATDLFAADFEVDDIKEEDIYLVWKQDGRYLNPEAEGVLKIVVDGGMTNKWVKNPILFDFISEFDDSVPIEDRLDPDKIDFVTAQDLFTLSLGGPPDIEVSTWSLEIDGFTEREIVLTYEEILAMPQKSVYATLETISNPRGGPLIGNAIWTGVPFAYILDLAGIKEEALEVAFYCEDGYSTSVTIEEALKDDVILAYRMNGKTLTPEHGYPVRMVLPEKYGMKWAKWIYRMELVDYDFRGYWEMQGWSDYAGRDAPGSRYF